MSFKVRVVLFDLDDTLYDHSYHITSAISALREKHAFLQDYPLEHLTQLSHKLLEEVHAKLLKGEISLEDARRIRWQNFLEIFRQEENHDPITFGAFYLNAYYESERVVPGSIELLKTLKKDFSIGIISNNLLAEQIEKMKRLGISEYIDFFAISEEVGAAKPDRKIFDVAIERSKFSAEESVLIGDSWENDIVGALNAGIRPIWLNRNNAESPDPRIAEISSLEPSEDVIRHILNEIPTPHITNPDPTSA